MVTRKDSVSGPVLVIVELTDGTRVREHFDQIRKFCGSRKLRGA